MARLPVTRGQFSQFAQATLMSTDGEKEGWSFAHQRGSWGEVEGANWRKPGFAQEEDHPVVCVSWFDAQGFVKWLRRCTGLPFCLPSEAQWEYACRGGSLTPFAWGAELLPGQANFEGSGAGRHVKGEKRPPGTTPAGLFPANGFGLHDLHGNCWEWCQDGFDEGFYQRPEACGKNPLCRHGGGYRVRRGGSWSYQPTQLRAAYRGRNYPDSRYADIGFRLALLAGT